VQDARKVAGGPRLEERVSTSLAKARESGRSVEVQGWQAALKGSLDLYQVTFSYRDNRQGVRAEWEANLATGQVRPMNALAESLEAG
jgi:hypothetical protein